jgi:hypothetical protein
VRLAGRHCYPQHLYCRLYIYDLLPRLLHACMSWIWRSLSHLEPFIWMT